MNAVCETSGLEGDGLHAVLAEEQPVVMRGLVADWPAVQAGRSGPAAMLAYLQRFDSGKPVDALMTPPDAKARLAYDEAMTGFNFVRNRLAIGAIAEQLLRYAQFASPPALAAQSALIPDCLPGFEQENRLDAVSVPPRIWLGNRITTPAHVDEWNNIGCVVGGRRRFTLFPPEQVANLYVGPLDFAPTGAPMSLVSPDDLDAARHPRYPIALAAARVAELSPGDAIYIPPLWWHQVESLDSLNVLVNYWWHPIAGNPAHSDPAFDALLHGILSIRNLPPATRRAWSAFFEQYVFGDDASALEHIPAGRRGILGRLSEAQTDGLRAHLARRLSR